MMCWAAKWLGKNKVYFKSWHDDDHITKIWEMIDKADAIIHYNGVAFDMKHLNREFLLSGLGPPSKYQNIDLLKEMRKNFKFASNKLEWTSIQLGYEGKVQNRGMQLWLDCLNDDASAWREMKKYNVQDVRLLEDVYHDLRPWIVNHPNYALYLKADRPTCRNCGSGKVKENGYERTSVKTYKRYKCLNCGANLSDTTIGYCGSLRKKTIEML